MAETPGGTVTAGAAVIAVNAWASHWKRFRRAITVRGSYIVLTAPAPERLKEIGWTDGTGVSDYRAALHYLRTTPDGRIAFGIGGMQPNLARTIGPRFAYDEHALRVAAAGPASDVPVTFHDVPIEAGWGGPIDVAGLAPAVLRDARDGDRALRDGVHRQRRRALAPGRTDPRASRARAVTTTSLELPFVDMEPRGSRRSRSVRRARLIANHAIRRKDDFEDRGEEPNPLVDFVAKLPRRLGYHLGP